MSRGTADYGNQDISFFSVTDPNNDALAERQGFIRLDNRGRVLFFDDFRQGLGRWRLQQSGTAIIPTLYYFGDMGIGYHGIVKFDPVANGKVSMMDNNIVLPVSKRLGVEFSFRVHANFGTIEVQLGHIYVLGTPLTAYFEIEANTGNLVIYSNLARTTIFTPPLLAYYYNGWISIKYVVDIENNKWVRMMVGNTQYDLSGYSLRSGVQGLQGSTSLLIRHTGASAVLKEPIYLGYVVISGDEP